MKNTYQIHRERRRALLAQMRAQAGGGLALLPTAPEVTRNRDSTYPYRFDSYFHYVAGFPEPEAVVALVAGRNGADSDRHILFCREKNAGTRDLGWLSLRSGRGARDLRLRRGPSDRGARPLAAGPGLGPARAVHAARTVRNMGPQGHRRPERGSRAGAHGRRRAGGDRRRARRARCAAAREGRARAQAHAPRCRQFPRRPIGARWSVRRPGWHEYQVEAELVARISAATEPRRSPIRRSSRAAPMPACCTIATTTARCRTASSC